ncbi:hypothetical protein P7K49_033984, partial [Saguinus oedipus]
FLRSQNQAAVMQTLRASSDESCLFTPPLPPHQALSHRARPSNASERNEFAYGLK